MATPLVQVPDEVADVINAGSWSQPITAVRSYADWDDEPTDNDTHVDVVLIATRVETEVADRAGSLDKTIRVHVCVRKKFAPSERTDGILNNAAVDPLVELVDEIHSHFVVDRFGDLPNVAWTETRLVQVFSRRMLREIATFVGIVELTFESHEAA